MADRRDGSTATDAGERFLGLARAMLAVAAMAVAVAVPPVAAQTTQDQLLARLNADAGFRARVPRGHRAEGLAFAGSVAPGALVWEGDPMEVAILPRGLASTVVRNCQSRNTPTASGFLEGRFRETRALTIEASITVGSSVSVEGTWPFGSAGAEQSLEVSTSVGTTSETSEELVFGQGFSTPVPPRTEFDIQLQMFEQKIAGQPFSFDAELRGPVRITHRPTLKWVASRGGLPADAVFAGRETSPTTGLVRALAVCRALRGNVWHPGKVVAGTCNYSFNGSENEATAFQVLVAPAGALAWRSRSAFERDFDNAAVKRGDSSAIEAGREARDDRYGGRLLVCRAAHRGGTHPGKVVINDCMFGYGGREIASGSYDVLTRTAAGTFTANLQDYLPVEDRSFRVEGSFEGARSMTYSVVYGAERQVDERFCPTAPVLASAERDSPAVRDASFAREPEPAAAPARAPGSPVPSAAPGRPVIATPLPSEPPIEGRVWVSAEVGVAAGDPVPRLVAFRLMRLERPYQLGADVLSVQEALRAAGWPIRADGFFGPRTAAALREFQRSEGLAPDGIAGPRTLADLGL
jgi:hypothetical protein